MVLVAVGRPALACRLLAASLVGPGVHRGHVAGRLALGADLPDERRARPHRLRDLPIRLARIGPEQLGDQVTLLLGGEVSAVDVGGDDVGGRIITGKGPEGRLNIGSNAGAITIAPVEDHAVEHDDRLDESVRLDVGDERVELLALHQREDVGERVKPEIAIARNGVFRYRCHWSYLSARRARSKRSRAFSCWDWGSRCLRLLLEGPAQAPQSRLALTRPLPPSTERRRCLCAGRISLWASSRAAPQRLRTRSAF